MLNPKPDETSVLDRPIAITFFKDQSASVKKDATMTPRALAMRILNRSAPTKAQLPWLKLASFGNRATERGSLRNNDNILSVSGLELDYDLGQIPMAEAHELLDKQNIAAILYTSPSHRLEHHKWRILAPFSEAMDAHARLQAAGRIAGLFRIKYGLNPFDPASWVASQSFYYGYTTEADVPFAHKVTLVDGEPIDLHDELDEVAIGKPATAPRHKDDRAAQPREIGEIGEISPLDLDEAERLILSGENYHSALLSIAGHFIARGASRDEVWEELDRLMQAVPPEVQRADRKRWANRSNKRHLLGLIDYCIGREKRHIFRAYGDEATKAENDPKTSTSDEDHIFGGENGSKSDPDVEDDKGAAPKSYPGIDAASLTAADIPPRPWLIPRVALRGSLTAIVAPGATGKSTLAVHLAIMAAAGQTWGPWTPRRPLKTLYINLEDDEKEKGRRFIAVAKAMGVAIPPGMITLSPHESMVIAKLSLLKAVARTPNVAMLKEMILAGGYDIVSVDPYVETHEVNENDNVLIKSVAAIWRELARQTSTGIILTHHARKGSAENGSEADMSRGAGSFINMCRCAIYMAGMKPTEAVTLGLPEEEARLYVSASDNMKQNYAPPADKTPWFKHVGIDIGNARGFDPGDNVGVLEPWDKPSAFEGLDPRTINSILDEISRGMLDADNKPTGQLYSGKPNLMSKPIWAGNVIVARGRSAAAAKEILKAWMATGLVYEVDFTWKSKDRVGLAVSNAKRPGATT